MEALLASLVAVALIEQGGSLHAYARGAIAGGAPAGAVWAGCAVALLAAMAAGAAGGAILHGLLPYRASGLLLALALLSAGAGGFGRVRILAPHPRLGAFGGAVLAGLVAGFGGAAQFLVCTIAARADAPVLAAVGGVAGGAAGLAPAILGGPGLARPIARVRAGVGVAFVLLGAIMALAALRLI